MGSVNSWIRVVGSTATVGLLAACGGGGGGSGAAPPAAWVSGQFKAQSSFAAQCVKPRSGTDPVSNAAYPDRQGTLLEEQNWLRSWTNDLYLWYDEVTDQNPATFASDASYFTALKTTALTASGNPKDKFHFTYATSVWEALSVTGVSAGYGATFNILASTPPRAAVVAYTEPGSAAASAPANLVRGTAILTVDGVDLVNANDQASIDTLNAGLTPEAAGETHTFTVKDPGAATTRQITLISADVPSTPVQNVHTIASSTGLVGYMLFNDHLATAEGELVTAFTTLQNAGVKDLVLDIRYNGGGYLDIASEVAYMIAGAGPTAGQTFELTQFNAKHPGIDPVNGGAITPTGFHSTTQGFSTTAGQALPTLNLAQVFILTGPGTCSASESIINSLRGVNVKVILIGTTTCGKPYGFYPTDNCAVTYFSIQFRGVNAQGFGDYTDGFTPDNTVTVEGYKVPGCSVADDYSHQLGDAAEGQLASALSYQQTGVCSTAPVSSAPRLVTGNSVPSIAGRPSSVLVKSFWQQNRILRRPASH